MRPTRPDLTDGHGGYIVAFVPVSFWRAGERDPASLVESVKAQEGLEDFDDDNGNRQSAVRLDPDVDESNVGYWISVPSGTPESAIDAAIRAYREPEDPPVPLAVTLAARLEAIDPATITATDPLSLAVKAALEDARP